MEALYIFLIVVAAIIALVISILILRRMKGSIEIVPDKFSYSVGETLQGKIILKIKKPISAEKLIVGLKGERIERSFSGGGKGSSSRVVPFFDFNQPLEGTKEYAPSDYTYNFSIKIPQNASQELGGIADSLVKSAQILSGRNSYTRWYLYVELKCKGINLSKSVQINIV